MASERGGLIAGIGRRGPYVRWKPKAGLFQRCMQRKLTGVPKARINASFKQAVKVCKVKSKAMKIVMGGKARKRKTTRRRGVGSRLMALVGEQAKQDGRVLRIATTTLPLADRVLLSKLGFRPVAETSSSAPDLPATSDFVELDPQGKG